MNLFKLRRSTHNAECWPGPGGCKNSRRLNLGAPASLPASLHVAHWPAEMPALPAKFSRSSCPSVRRILTLALAGLLLATASLCAQPVITAPPTNKTDHVGETAFFTVAATGAPPLTYQWRKDGADLLGATGATCALGLARTNQAGSYTVVTSNSAGSVTSEIGRAHV